MKLSSLKTSSLAVALLSAAIAVTAMAQAPATPPAGTPSAKPHFPPPKNLQVLPKTLTTEQVLGIMHTWAGSLGTGCDHCHAADPNHMGPNGRPMLNFADDSKPEKSTARMMYKMVEDINSNYISMVDNSGQPVTCGTCHRGHVSPPPFVIPPEEHEHHGPPAGEKPPAPPAQ
ncbi:MAG TPA: c-type cytochrome [Terracidiphilus sp.]|nr:c-type cytochrome [Terracidiphilus sp.]